MAIIVRHVSAGRWSINSSTDGTKMKPAGAMPSSYGPWQSEIEAYLRCYLTRHGYPIPSSVSFFAACHGMAPGDIISVTFRQEPQSSRQRRRGLEAFAKLITEA